MPWLEVTFDASMAWPVVVLHLLVALPVTVHVLLTKESPRAAAGWMGLVWLSPFVGGALYGLLGINRVARRARKLRGDGQVAIGPAAVPTHASAVTVEDAMDGHEDSRHLAPMIVALDRAVGRPLLRGNDIDLLVGGEQALPAMLDAIGRAERTLALQTFIWDRDDWGERFVEAVAQAAERGVDVRLLIDGVGARFSWPTILPRLRERGVRVEQFLWGEPWRMPLVNLRNHRKILVVDGREAFTGGMNLRGSFVQEGDGPRTAHQDLHARLRGPIVGELLQVFAADWHFETDEHLEGEGWWPDLDDHGEVVARVVPDGPDEDHDKAALTFFEALSCARRSVGIVTPYFLPEEALSVALIAAARRGVEVDVVVPAKGNQPMAQWAMQAELHRWLDKGVRVWAQEAPFDHTKLMVVDGAWVAFGSANWDPRSLRLNFELLVEAWDRDLAASAAEVVGERLSRSVPWSSEVLQARALPIRLRDGLARLFKPYL